MLRSGDLRHRITLKGPMEQSDGHHGTRIEMLPYASRIPAKVAALSGRTLERARQISPQSTHRIELRYRRDVLTGHVVVFHDPDLGDRSFEVVAPPASPNEDRVLLELLCREDARARASAQAPSEAVA